MSQSHDNQFGRRFFEEALPLVSTYFSGESVELTGRPTSIGMGSDTECVNFSQYIRFRHAIACCTELFPIIQKIESSLSNVTVIARSETKGVIRGRLDIPRYVARKSWAFSWPRSYPILTTIENSSTPENELVIRVFRTLLQRLPLSQFPASSAEMTLGHRYKNWILSRMKRAPWSSISSSSSLTRLYKEACRRISRKQTGNERAYSALVEFIRDWRLLGDEFSGSASSEKFIDSFLSFPAEQFFLDRVYEIWCIHSVADAFMKIGGEILHGPSKMFESRRKPIYIFDLESIHIEVWFQRSLPSENTEWFYDSTGSGLRGIPDITIIANSKHRLIIDAKNRIVTGTTRSEETYKMLGYFENFRATLGGETNWGVLAFVSPNGFSRSIKSSNGRCLELISANPTTLSDCNFSEDIIKILKAWINDIDSLENKQMKSYI